MTKSKFVIRSEKIEDYFQICEVCTLAFDKDSYMCTGALVDTLRHRKDFDVDLSLVAEIDGKVAGHVLFMPYTMKIDEKDLAALALAPLAVRPEFQKQGIGKSLIREGMKRARDKGYTFSFLLGHDSYYPKFGYQTGMFGSCNVKIARKDIKDTGLKVEERRVLTEDISELMTMWKLWFDQVDLSILPKDTITDWLSVSKTVQSSTLLVNGKLAGYVRYDVHHPEKIKYFLAKDPQATQAVIFYLSQKIKNDNMDELLLPVHPESSAAKEMILVPFRGETQAWDAAMIKIIDSGNKAIVDYCNEVSAGLRSPGFVQWPVEFDFL